MNPVPIGRNTASQKYFYFKKKEFMNEEPVSEDR